MGTSGVRLSPLISRLLALGLLLGLLFLLFGLVAAPLMTEYEANEAAIARAHGLETRYRTIGASRAALMRQLTEMERSLQISKFSFSGTGDALTGAKIQSTVKDLIGKAGGRLNSTQILTAVEEAGFRRVAIRVQMVSDIAALQAVLHKLETMTPYLFIDNMVLRKNAATRRRPARRRTGGKYAARPPEDDGQLNIRFDVLGYSKPGDA